MITAVAWKPIKWGMVYSRAESSDFVEINLSHT